MLSRLTTLGSAIGRSLRLDIARASRVFSGSTSGCCHFVCFCVSPHDLSDAPICRWKRCGTPLPRESRQRSAGTWSGEESTSFVSKRQPRSVSSKLPRRTRRKPTVPSTCWNSASCAGASAKCQDRTLTRYPMAHNGVGSTGGIRHSSLHSGAGTYRHEPWFSPGRL